MTLKHQRAIHAKGKCELCGEQGHTAHHIFCGRKQRKKSECFETVRWICNKCHAYIHGSKGFEVLQALQVEACNDLVDKIGEEKTRELLGKIYFHKEPKI